MANQRLLLLLFFIATTSSGASGQDVTERRADGLPETRATRPMRATTDSDLEAVKIQSRVKPAFIINPLVHRLSARRGQSMTYEFKIEANARPTRLEIAPVAMLQQEHGVIMPDPAALPPNVVQLLTPASVSLQVGESHTIRCQMRVPPGNAPFLSYGVLVKELPPEEKPAGAGIPAPQVGIRFLTQYLLRTDIQVIGVQGDSVRQLEIDTSRIVSRDGNATILAYIDNPTQTSMEFEVRATLISKDSGRTYPSKLWMPVRVSQPVPDRHRVRILGETRLRLEGALNEPVFPGQYEMKIDLLYQNRVYKTRSFPLAIRSGDFPAQDATIVRVTRDIAIEPPHVELSLRRGGNRLQSITVVNGSQQKIVARLAPKPLIGDLHQWISFRPDVVELLPGRKRKVLVMLGKKRNFEEHTYAIAQVTVSPEVGEAIGTQDIPVALLTNSESTAEVESPALEWKIQSRTAGFEVPVRNSGRRHLELSGTLTLRDQFGRGFVVDDGYGRWILPGREDKLWFAFPQIPPPGSYDITAQIQMGENQKPLEIKQTIELRAAVEERVSSEDAPARRE